MEYRGTKLIYQYLVEFEKICETSHRRRRTYKLLDSPNTMDKMGSPNIMILTCYQISYSVFRTLNIQTSTKCTLTSSYNQIFHLLSPIFSRFHVAISFPEEFSSLSHHTDMQTEKVIQRLKWLYMVQKLTTYNMCDSVVKNPMNLKGPLNKIELIHTICVLWQHILKKRKFPTVIAQCHIVVLLS